MSIAKKGLSVVTGAAILLGICQLALAQSAGQALVPGHVTNSLSSMPVLPGSSKARTFLRILTPPQGYAAFNAYIKAHPQTGVPYTGYTQQTPASLACIYGLVAAASHCNPNTVTTVATGGSKAIALVDAYDYPNALSDLQAFSTQFGLPAPTLNVVYASGSQPADAAPYGWQLEEALDIEWAHAMAPSATIYLVEAASSTDVDLLKAVKVASGLVNAAGGGEVSMSWGEPEFAGMNLLDSYFQEANVVFFASSGDYSGVSWPCVSPYVVCVGGTTLRSDVTGNFLQEVAWVDGGGGPSQVYPRPAYQSSVASAVGTQRGVPDVASAADPYNGAWVYWTPTGDVGGWWLVGGTSWSSPSFAGMVNNAGHFLASGTAELTQIYKNAATVADFRDIVDGYCFFQYADAAVKGWDYCTGVGVNNGKVGK
jgi:kumamolisin